MPFVQHLKYNMNVIHNIYKMYIIIYHIRSYNIYHHHHVTLVARISLTLSRHSSLSFIALGRSSGQHPVSSHSCWMYVRAGRPAFARPCVGVHKSTSLLSINIYIYVCVCVCVCIINFTLYIYNVITYISFICWVFFIMLLSCFCNFFILNFGKDWPLSNIQLIRMHLTA